VNNKLILWYGEDEDYTIFPLKISFDDLCEADDFEAFVYFFEHNVGILDYLGDDTIGEGFGTDVEPDEVEGALTLFRNFLESKGYLA